jgi:hypothetical protein
MFHLRSDELERIGGHDPRVEETADGFEVTFVVPATDRPDALRIGESVMRTVGPGGFWQGTSGALVAVRPEQAPFQTRSRTRETGRRGLLKELPVLVGVQPRREDSHLGGTSRHGRSYSIRCIESASRLSRLSSSIAGTTTR